MVRSPVSQWRCSLPLNRKSFSSWCPNRLVSLLISANTLPLVFHSIRSFSLMSEWPTERERFGYVCNPRSLKEGTETSHPIATVTVPTLSFWVIGSAPQRKHELMRCTCCLLYQCCGVWQPDAKYCMPMSIGSYSCTRSGLVSLARSQFVCHDVSIPSFRERGLHT